MEEIIRNFYQCVPMLGICLGHQAIGEVFHARVEKAQTMHHGEASMITIDTSCSLFFGLEKQIMVGRYHSLICKEPNTELRIVGQSEEQEIMAIAHKKYPVYGIQFHPESILTPMGKKIIHNFLKGVLAC